MFPPAPLVMEKPPPKNTSDPHLNRACDACRLHKVRCLPNTSTTTFPNSKACERCLKTDRHCVFTAPVKRRQRKRTDTRVAELEREVEAMKNLFDKRKTAAKPLTADEKLAAEARNLGVSIAARKERSQNQLSPPQTMQTSYFLPTSPSGERTSPTPENISTVSSQLDVIDRGILTWESAEKLFHTFNTDLYQHYPCVYFPPGTSAENIRRTKPTLFLAVIAAASGKTEPHLYSTLNSEVVASYVQRTIIDCEKSLELVQAEIVTCIWYYPPGNWVALKLYEYINMATTMALSIGLGTNPNVSKRRWGENSGSIEGQPMQIDEDLERRRTILTCYLVSTAASMSLRRPNSYRSNHWINDCIEFLGIHGSSSALDHILVAWAKLFQVCEDIVVAFSFDDLGNIADLAEPRVQIMLNGFQQRLLAWRGRCEAVGSMNIALVLVYHHIEIFIHEIALHDDHNPSGFMPPYKLDEILSISQNIHANSAYVKESTIIISSAHAILDIFLETNVEVLRSFPIYNFVRLAYAVLVLTKLLISSKTSTSLIGSALDDQTIRLGFYIQALIEKLGAAVGPMECRAPFTFLGLLMRLRIWYKSQQYDTQFKPPTNLSKLVEDCYLPPPPTTKRNQTHAETLGITDANADSEAHVLAPDQMESLRSMGLDELATMQPLPNFDLDWQSFDVNQFMDLGSLDPTMVYNDWALSPPNHSPSNNQIQVDFTSFGGMKGPELAQKSDLRFAYGIKYPEHEDFVYWSSGLDRVPSYLCGICKDGEEYSVVQQVPEQFQNRPTPISLATLLNNQFLYPYRPSRHISLRYAPLSHAERVGYPQCR
ncbi:hypothetical protein HYFRA_00005135 [Hymenoscyphus fraxineus]|uniref:Zn(2)-C6 fungal-type domain-containing protein n=1 Tax=Hymenoscyphus fraxineus TaxID=746836 RepID=A0A9N9Q1U0_9HELO|nr:hypothetical protein HYFRA_00005135 [Hymenoscyphus fraxineus]